MKKYSFQLTGITSLIMHADDVLAADRVKMWRGQPENRASPKGDDRYPPWAWQTYLYLPGDVVVWPTTNLQTCLMEGGKSFSLQGSRKSLKAATMAMIKFSEEFLDVRTFDGRLVTIEQLGGLDPDADFAAHVDAVAEMGIFLDCRRAKVGAAKHVRCRPKFPPGWTISGQFSVTDSVVFTPKVLSSLLNHCGNMIGLGDWRPGAPKSPGTHGRFSADVQPVK